MAVITLHFTPQKLGIATAVRIVIPLTQAPEEDFKSFYKEEKKLPVLWLLHGGSDNYSDWYNYTEVQQLSDKYGYAVVMPDAQVSSYSNMEHGPRWLDYFSEELPEYIYARFPFSRKREDNFISGMSMGGQGTFKLALRYPERYSVAVPIASGVDVVNHYAALKPGEKSMYWGMADCYGHEDDPSQVLGGQEDNYARLREAVAAGKKLPHIMQAQGTEDFTYEGNLRFYNFARELGVHIDWIEAPGVHDWKSWSYYIIKAFEYIAKCREEDKK